MYKPSIASLDDIAALNKLINGAYRGESSRKGWTTEAELLDGIRIDEAELRNIISNKDATLLKYEEQGGLLACVLLEKQQESLYLGMLTVSPLLQGKGIGKILLAEAEQVARQQNYSKIVMTVISVRTELIEWYKRHGYVDTGIKKPFPAEAEKFGKPKCPLEFIVMEKVIRL